MIEIEALELNLGEFTLEDFYLKIQKGEYYVLLGPSGVGKTVLLETIAGFHKLKKGRIILNGVDVTHTPPEGRNIAYVPQTLGLFPHLNVEENILFGMRAKRMNMINSEEEVKKISEIFGISGLLKRYTNELSEGEKRRVALARALIVKPELLLLDEALSALPPLQRNQLQHFIKSLHITLKFTALHVTHDFEEAFLLGDVVSVLLDGKIQQTGKKNEIYFHPRTKAVAEFLGFKNIFKGEVCGIEGSLLRIYTEGIGEITVARTFRNEHLNTGAKVYWGVRPEEVRILRDSSQNEQKDNPLHGRITEVFEKGFSHTLVFKLANSGAQFEIEIPHAAYRKLKIQQGMDAVVTLGRERIWLAKE
jgi:ABC-type Fe3+/spermidine/putrescine transport system ATPase subunit